MSPASPVTRTATDAWPRSPSSACRALLPLSVSAPWRRRLPPCSACRLLRSEDPRFLRGEGRYLDNVEIPGALHAAFVRSIMPHARIDGVDVSGSLGAPGVVGAYVADGSGPGAAPALRHRRGRRRPGSSRGCSAGSRWRGRWCGSWGRSSRSWSPRRPARRSMPRSRSPSSTSRSPSWWTRRRRSRTEPRCSGRSSGRTSRTRSAPRGPTIRSRAPTSWSVGGS